MKWRERWGANRTLTRRHVRGILTQQTKVGEGQLHCQLKLLTLDLDVELQAKLETTRGDYLTGQYISS